MAEQHKKELKGIWIPIHIWECPDITPVQKMMLAEIWHLSRNGKGCTASNSYFANLFGVKPRTIQRYIEGLRDSGLIEIHYFDHEDVGTRREMMPTQQLHMPYATELSPGGDDRTDIGGDDRTDTHRIYNREYSKSNTKVLLTGGFSVKDWVNREYVSAYRTYTDQDPTLNGIVYGSGKRLFADIAARLKLDQKKDPQQVYNTATKLVHHFYRYLGDIMPYRDAESYPTLATMTNTNVLNDLWQHYTGGIKAIKNSSGQAEVSDDFSSFAKDNKL